MLDNFHRHQTKELVEEWKALKEMSPEEIRRYCGQERQYEIHHRARKGVSA